MTENHPTVSIVIPTYNRADLIARSIQSVLNQSYPDFEVIVVDDGSTDGTKEVVENFNDKRIKYIRLNNNRGAGAARNVGIRSSMGKFIAFQDSDDMWLPEKLKKHLSIFAKELPNVGIVYSDMLRIFKDGTAKTNLSPSIVSGRLIDPKTQFYQVLNLGIQSTVIKKECFERVGYFNEKFPCYEDLELFIRLSKRYEFYHIKEPLVKYYETEGLSKGMPRKYAARELLLKLYYRDLLKRNKTFLIKEITFILKARLQAVIGEKRANLLKEGCDHIMLTKMAYLTVDGGPSLDMKAKVNYLAAKQISAIWFCRGDCLEERSELAIYAIKKGFVIANHSYSHPKFSDLSLEACFEEIKNTDAIIERLYSDAGVQWPAKFFRFPYGDKGGLKYNKVFESYEGEGKVRKDKIQRFLRDLGYTQPRFENISYHYYRKAGLLDDIDCYWTYDVMEWSIFLNKPLFGIDNLQKVLERMDEDVPEQCRGLNYADSEDIILLHDHSHSTHIFKPIIDRLHQKGIVFKLPEFS